MLKSLREGALICVTQPDHAAVSGYLAAHWGNDEFAAAGAYAPVDDAARLRAETLFAIAQHDNGWWEWEADPPRSPDDGLPLDLVEASADPAEGSARWRRGIRRFGDGRPYASLLIALHARGLYTPRAGQAQESGLPHPLYGASPPPAQSGAAREATERFLGELSALEAELRRGVESRGQADWLAPDLLLPHVRLLQLTDALSLALCSRLLASVDGANRGFGEDRLAFEAVPRAHWRDRVALRLVPAGEGRVVVEPYPFDRDGLEVTIPCKRFPVLPPGETRSDSAWHAAPAATLELRLVSR